MTVSLKLNLAGNLARWSSAAAFYCVMSASAFAAPLTVGNLLASNLNTGTLTEYTQQGSFVQQFNTPDFAGGFHSLRDIVTGQNGSVYMFNGTFTPQMTTLSPTTGAYSNATLSGWSTINNISYGGIGTFGNYVYATDMFTYSGGEDNGIVRFNTQNGTQARFAAGNDFDDLTIGLDGLLYASAGGYIKVYDPNTMALIRNLPLNGAGDVRGIAVDASGLIYTADWAGAISKYSSTGVFIQSFQTGIGSLTDIDVSSAGMLIVGSRFGTIGEVDTSFEHYSIFSIPTQDTVHVAFITSGGQTVPEAPSIALLLAGIAALVRSKRKSSRPA